MSDKRRIVTHLRTAADRLDVADWPDFFTNQFSTGHSQQHDPTGASFSESFPGQENSRAQRESDKEVEPEIDQREAEIAERVAQAEEKLREADQRLAEVESREAAIAGKLDEARKEAEQILAQAQSRTDQIEAEAYQGGFSQGEEAGKRLADQKAESVLRQLRQVLEEAGRQQQEIASQQEREMVKVAVQIAMEIVHQRISSDERIVLEVARAAIGRLKRATRLTLRVSPHDFGFIEDHASELEGLLEGERSLAIEPDESISRGGCRLTSDTGEVDATIGTMIRKIVSRIWGPEGQARILDAEPSEEGTQATQLAGETEQDDAQSPDAQ